MQHEKYIKRDDGSQVLIEVSVFTDHFRENICRYDVRVSSKGKGRRNFNWDADAATTEELYQAKLELWEKLKPIQ